MGWQDWRNRNRGWGSGGGGGGSSGGGGGGSSRNNATAANPWAGAPQSEGQWTHGYNSPEHNQYVRDAQAAGGLPTWGGYTGNSSTPGYYDAIRNGYQSPSYAPSYSGGGGGGWGGGGGGGGGGAPKLTQAMLDQMLAALGAQGPQLGYTPVDLPDFTGQRLAAFNAQPYTQALGQLQQGVQADLAAATRAGTQATQALQNNYTNAYANAQQTAAPAAAQQGTALQGTAGGGGEQAVVATNSDAAAASDQASFANLLNVLAATDQSAQASRLNQVAFDQGTAGNAIRAQQRGISGGINMAQAQARNQWTQAAAERDYQNSLMRQQWNREEMMRNQDLRNQMTQANWQQRNSMIESRLTPLLQLLGTPGSGIEKLDLSAIQKLLAGWRG